MKILIIITAIIILIVGLLFLGLYIKARLIKKLIEERNNLNLRTQEGKARARILNKRIDRLYGYKR